MPTAISSTSPARGLFGNTLRVTADPFNILGIPNNARNPASAILNRNVFRPLDRGLLFMAPARSGVGLPPIRLSGYGGWPPKNNFNCDTDGLGDWLSDTTNWLKSVPGVSVIANVGESIGGFFSGPSQTTSKQANPTVTGVTSLSSLGTKVDATVTNAANMLGIKLPSNGYAGLSAADQYRIDQQTAQLVSGGSSAFWGTQQQAIANAIGGMSTSPAKPTNVPALVAPAPTQPKSGWDALLGTINTTIQQAVPLVGQYYGTKLTADLQAKMAESQAKIDLAKATSALDYQAKLAQIQAQYSPPVAGTTPVQSQIVGVPYNAGFGVPATSAATGTNMNDIFAALMLTRSGIDPATAAADANKSATKAPALPESGSMMPLLLVGALAVGVFFLAKKKR